MPLFRITVEKYASIVGEYWTNVYWATGATVDDFTADVNAIVAAERPLYPTWVTVTKVRVDDGQPNTDVYRTYVRNEAGTRTAISGDSLPLFVTARVDFSASMGRPSRKYIRSFLTENDTTMTAIAAAALTMLQTYGDAIVATAAVVDVDGQEFTGAVPYTAPQMRQLRRGSKKKVTP